MENTERMERLEQQYRAALWWNRFWLCLVATIAVVGATGLAFRLAKQQSAADKRRSEAIRTAYTASGDLRVTVPSEFSGVLLLKSASEGHRIVTFMPSEYFGDGISFGSKDVVIPRRSLEELRWSDPLIADRKRKVPAPGTPITVLYVPLQESEWRGE